MSNMSANAMGAVPFVELTEAFGGDGAVLFGSEGSAIRLVAEGFSFTEGPAYDTQSGWWYWSDIPESRLWRYHQEHGLQLFRDPAAKPNGNCFYNGYLVTCEHETRRVTLTDLDESSPSPKRVGRSEAVVWQFEGKKLNSPNDVTVRSDGTIWFTDPDYGVVAKMGHGNAIEQPHNNVFCFDPATKHLRSVSKNECRPNGLCFDPSETYLYVADSGAWFQRLWHPENPHEVVRYRVEADGSLSDRQVIIQLSKDAGGIPDGLRCDAEGHIYVATLEGVHIYTPTGTLLAKIRTPETTANLCFGGPNNTTLLLTSTSCVWAVEMQIAGANVSNVKKERGQEEIRNIDRRDP
ncbi:unnamed protein product [Durusdinium trenchii]|uniref:Gluconolactonase (D-glucono-delta-lactone lactonohydrolase) [Cleaved into: Gluconolactonase n=2 Tax=Durusdinium trenchii TaxID=1381693 RepID=A0ABP0MKM5_9DINO